MGATLSKVAVNSGKVPTAPGPGSVPVAANDAASVQVGNPVQDSTSNGEVAPAQFIHFFFMRGGRRVNKSIPFRPGLNLRQHIRAAGLISMTIGGYRLVDGRGMKIRAFMPPVPGATYGFIGT